MQAATRKQSKGEKRCVRVPDLQVSRLWWLCDQHWSKQAPERVSHVEQDKENGHKQVSEKPAALGGDNVAGVSVGQELGDHPWKAA